MLFIFFFQAEDGIRDTSVTGVQTCALPILKHLLKHPFYLAWTRGELSKEALADYARQYYHHVAAFTTYLSAVHTNCDDQERSEERRVGKECRSGLGAEW